MEADSYQMKIAWAAGFFDGEAHIDLRTIRSERYSRHGVRHTPRIVLAQTEQLSIGQLQKLFGGSTRLRKGASGNHRAIWEWYVSGARSCQPVLEKVLPHLIVKRAEAEIVLEFCQQVQAKGGKPLTAAEFEARVDMSDRMQALRDSRRPGRRYRGPAPTEPVPDSAPHPNAKLTFEQVAKIRASKKSASALAKEYGVAVSNIRMILAGKTWK